MKTILDALLIVDMACKLNQLPEGMGGATYLAEQEFVEALLAEKVACIGSQSLAHAQEKAVPGSVAHAIFACTLQAMAWSQEACEYEKVERRAELAHQAQEVNRICMEFFNSKKGSWGLYQDTKQVPAREDYGWITPDGKLHLCNREEHDAAVERLGMSVEQVERLGWIRMSGIERGYTFVGKEMTQVQLDILFDLGFIRGAGG